MVRQVKTTLSLLLIIRSDRCALEYQRIVEITADVAPTMQKAAVPVQRQSMKRQLEEESESDDEPSQFRRVRIKCRQRARKQRSAGEVVIEAFKSGEETLRCVCGTQHGLTSAALMADWLVPCNSCNVWQHRSCVGFANGKEGFYCGHCLPRARYPGNRIQPTYTTARLGKFSQECYQKTESPQ